MHPYVANDMSAASGILLHAPWVRHGSIRCWTFRTAAAMCCRSHAAGGLKRFFPCSWQLDNYRGLQHKASSKFPQALTGGFPQQSDKDVRRPITKTQTRVPGLFLMCSPPHELCWATAARACNRGLLGRWTVRNGDQNLKLKDGAVGPHGIQKWLRDVDQDTS